MTGRDVFVKATNWCCMGPWPQADCEHVLSHFHADCDLCRKSPTCALCQEQQKACGRVHTSTRVWGADPAEVIAKMHQHVTAVHSNQPGQQELFTMGGL